MDGCLQGCLGRTRQGSRIIVLSPWLGGNASFCPLHRNGCSGVDVLVVPPNLVLNSHLPVGNTLMKDSVAVISGLLFELLKTVASAGQVFTLSCHVQLPCQSLWKYMGRSIWDRLSQPGLRSFRLRLSDMKPVAGN